MIEFLTDFMGVCFAMRNKPHSSAKLCFSRPKMVTRKGLVAKIGHFLLQNGDEIGARRQNSAFFTGKW
ncbi:hypothetical protein CQJ30_18465 [Caldibacillus thermoamylovorans]|nr:hypothetical protein CQJ30_18465 [Caldibacillus thermoamylovorans]